MAAAVSHCGLWQIQMQIRSTDTADGPKVWMMERPLSLVQAVELGKLKQSRKNRFWLVPSMYRLSKVCSLCSFSADSLLFNGIIVFLLSKILIR
jgi:hypothetical protein